MSDWHETHRETLCLWNAAHRQTLQDLLGEFAIDVHRGRSWRRNDAEAIRAALAEIARLQEELGTTAALNCLEQLRRVRAEQRADLDRWNQANAEANAEIARLTAENERLRIEAQAVANKLQFVSQAAFRRRHVYDENGICRCGASCHYATNLSDECPLAGVGR